ncbi:cytochrome ubiquinol oxidase subunit I [Vibrio parahaemolyticus]|nr:cytochrome ubiquinol oxidase subunit I [Vibrio parahaemolyticus]MDN4719121.1 cytochrome ubiquinol oxidase subunit I [Vibrio parahaemolyticus]MDN4727259.1 cytochrome ubiquinol oxidase subunit I [Vibrio parahaemolyticus]
MGPSGLIAILAGWFTTEVGRQPWVVYGVQKRVTRFLHTETYK